MTAAEEISEPAAGDDGTASGDAADPGQRRPRLLFRNRDYTGWWIGDTVSEFGDALSGVAYPLLILAVTGSAAQAGVAGAAGGVGMLVTMLVGGALADRFSRRTMLLAGPLAQAAVVATVVVAVLAGHVTVAHIAVVGFVQGLVGGLAGGAQFAALRRVVPEEQLPTAFAQQQSRAMAIRLTGPATGGFLFGLTRWAPFLGDAASFLAGALGVASIRRPLGPDRGELAPREPILASIGAGLRFVRRDDYLRFLTAWVAVANASMNGLRLLVILLVLGRHGGASLVGAVGSIAAVGGLAGASLSVRMAARVPGRLLVVGVSWLSAGVVAGIAVVPVPWLIGVLMALMMFLVSPLNVVFATYEARSIPDELLGRVTSAINFGAASLRWAGPLVAGALAAVWGAPTATLVFAGIFATVAMSTHIASGLRVLDEPLGEGRTAPEADDAAEA